MLYVRSDNTLSDHSTIWEAYHHRFYIALHDLHRHDNTIKLETHNKIMCLISNFIITGLCVQLIMPHSLPCYIASLSPLTKLQYRDYEINTMLIMSSPILYFTKIGRGFPCLERYLIHRFYGLICFVAQLRECLKSFQ